MNWKRCEERRYECPLKKLNFSRRLGNLAQSAAALWDKVFLIPNRSGGHDLSNRRIRVIAHLGRCDGGAGLVARRAGGV
jgi:hypothetical protein